MQALGITLPLVPRPAGSYVPVVQINDLVYVSGQIPIDTNAEPPFVKYKGKIGQDTTLEKGQQAALLCTLNVLSLIKNHLRSLDRIKQVVKVAGYINSIPTFSDHPKVINPASELIMNIFGDKGKHTRLAIGVGSLPLESVVEIEYIFQVF
ncbi:MAG: RidA family protein [Nitrososphaeraceae archaeon]|nr:RidA family protein [Nitrososphaeraceae archaeon]